MNASSYLRVVVSRRGRVKASEFRLRPGEIGLSLFSVDDSIVPAKILQAVNSAGKQGELAVVEIAADVFDSLGSKIVSTPGGTPNPEVNRKHVEARWPLWKRLLLRLRGIAVHDRFNEVAVSALSQAAKPIQEEE